MKPLSRRSRVLILLALLGLSAVAGLVFVADRCANPPDRVVVSIHNLPQGTVFACLACESGGVLRTMRWYETNYWVLNLPWDPAIWPTSRRDPRNPDASQGGMPVKWISGERYGVVTMDTKYVYRITWLEPEGVKITGGTGSLDLSNGRPVPLTGEEVHTLGLVTLPCE